MSVKYLNIDSDIEIANIHAILWRERGIGFDRFDTMTEGIKKLLTNEEYLFIAINGDVTDFMPLLKTMRDVTNFPILIVTSRFTTEKEITALENGADLYARWHETPENNIASVLAHVKRLSERSKMTRPSTEIMVYRNLLLNPAQHKVYIRDNKINFTRQDFNLLNYLMMNHGKTLTYKQMFLRVWGNEYEDNAKDVLWNAIKRLRKKLRTASDTTEYIETVRDVGYGFPSLDI
jgi:DNA-binding response OmpR family regulator